MAMTKCEKCGDYDMGLSYFKHHCELFNVINEDGEEYEIYSNDEEGAALKYAEESNVEGDYYLMNDSVEITVDGSKYEISAEPDVHYSANKKSR